MSAGPRSATVRRRLIDMSALAGVAMMGVALAFFGSNEHARRIGAALIGWAAGYTWKERDIRKSLAPLFALREIALGYPRRYGKTEQEYAAQFLRDFGPEDILNKGDTA